MNHQLASQPIKVEAVSGFFRNFPVLPNGLSQAQQTAIQLLVMGESQCSVAASLKVSPRTIYNWTRHRLFRRALNRIRQQLWHQAADRLRSLIHPSLDELEKQLRDRHHRVRYHSANAILRHSNLRKTVPLRQKTR